MEREKVEIIEHNEPGYQTKLVFENWRIGLIRFTDRFKNPTYLESHTLTDEAFVLLSGEAVLMAREKDEISYYRLEKNKIYNVPQAVFHNILMNETAVIMVVENSETSRDNTIYTEFDPVSIPLEYIL